MKELIIIILLVVLWFRNETGKTEELTEKILDKFKVKEDTLHRDFLDLIVNFVLAFVPMAILLHALFW